MKYIFHFIIPFWFFWAAGCSSPTEPESLADSFFPISEVTSWQYLSNTPRDSTILLWKVSGETQIGGLSYFLVAESYPGTEINPAAVYYRKNGTVLYQKIADQPEEIIADFALNSGDVAYWDRQLKVTSKTEASMTFDTGQRGQYRYSITFRKGYGVSSRTFTGVTNESIVLSEMLKVAGETIHFVDGEPKLL